MKKVSRRSGNDLRIPVYLCTVYQKHFFEQFRQKPSQTFGTESQQ